jgi:hypothetical protein
MQDFIRKYKGKKKNYNKFLKILKLHIIRHLIELYMYSISEPFVYINESSSDINYYLLSIY